MDGETATIGTSAGGDEAREWSTSPYPWRRYCARIIDVGLIGGVLLGAGGLLVGLFAPDPVYDFVVEEARWKDWLVWQPLPWLLAMPVMAALVSRGTTPGKWLLGLRVRTADGARPALGQALAREVRALVFGAGMALPLVSLFTMLAAYTRLTEHGSTSWDERTGLVVEGRAPGGMMTIRIWLGFVAVAGLLLWGLIDRLAAAA